MTRRVVIGWLVLTLLLTNTPSIAVAAEPPRSTVEEAIQPKSVYIGAKKFTESIIIAEIGRLLIVNEGQSQANVRVLGGTSVMWQALLQGDIDIYPDYTGTVRREILKQPAADLNAALRPFGIRVSGSLGFRNNYALGMRRDVAHELGIRTISDLAKHPQLAAGFTAEFIDREDGWRGLKSAYGLPQTRVNGMAHAIAYQALVDRSIQITDVYTTDGEIAQHDLITLEDDRQFFPSYEAIWLYREDFARRNPQALEQLLKLEQRIDERAMRAMNSRVQTLAADEIRVAQAFVESGLRWKENVATGLAETWKDRLPRTTLEHLLLVVPSLLIAIAIAIPLGVLAARKPTLGGVLLSTASIIQTIPSLALLLLLMPVMKWLLGQGTGEPTAIAALSLYALLPIVRNTHAGIVGIPHSLVESADALGLRPITRLWRVELPLAFPSILAGVRTAAVITVGTGTLGGFIGAGGYGLTIYRGLEKVDTALLLEGAIPAALMAMLVDAVFWLCGRLAIRH